LEKFVEKQKSSIDQAVVFEPYSFLFSLDVPYLSPSQQEAWLVFGVQMVE
jgi:hypothetical protein